MSSALRTECSSARGCSRKSLPGRGAKGALLQSRWEWKLVQPWGTEQHGGSLKKLNREAPRDPAIPLLGTDPDETMIQKKIHAPQLFRGELFTIARTCKTSYVPISKWMQERWSIKTMEYYSAIKKNSNNRFRSTMLDLETVTLSKTKTKVMMLLMCGMQNMREILTCGM